MTAPLSSSRLHARDPDPRGDPWHFAAALAHLAALPLSTAASSVTFIVLFVITCLRAPKRWQIDAPLRHDRVLMLMLLWIAYAMLSLLWSADVELGFDELGACRMVALPFLLWPVVDRAPWLVAAALVGVAGQNVAQLLQATEIINARPQDPPGRFGGWIHPIQSGAWCAAALCWHLCAIMQGRRRLVVISSVGALVAAAGLVATGSRGPWLAALLALPPCVLFTMYRVPTSRRRGLALIVIAVVGAAVTWPVARTKIMPRIEAATSEVEAALERDVYTSDVGLRIGLWSWAWTLWTDAPIVGHGAGSFQISVSDLDEFKATIAAAPEREEFITRDHPHNSPLHILSTLGIVGALLAAILGVLVFIRALRDRLDHVYAAAAPFVLISWVAGSQFDAYHLNGHLLGLFMLVVALTVPYRWPLRERPAGNVFRTEVE